MTTQSKETGPSRVNDETPGDASPLLSPEEIKAIAGGYEQPRRQLAELRAQGFWRARLSRSHKVILERSHYEAVCSGALVPRGDASHTHRPKLRLSTEARA